MGCPAVGAVVVGGGIGGLTASAAPHRHGWRVTVLERSRSLDPVGAGIALAPNSLRASTSSNSATRSANSPPGRVTEACAPRQAAGSSMRPGILLRNATVAVVSKTGPGLCLRSFDGIADWRTPRPPYASDRAHTP